MPAKSNHKVVVSRHICPVENCDVMVYVTYDQETGEQEITNFACDRQGKCGIPLFDPCPLFLELVERRDARRSH